MSYMSALEAAGAKINRYQYFGDYQGTILVEVEYKDQRGWVSIGYGSCSICDSYEAFEDSLGWDHTPTVDQLAEFGKDYLDYIEKESVLLESLQKQAEWDTEADAMIEFIQNKEATGD